MSSVSEDFSTCPRDVLLDIFEHSLPLQRTFKHTHSMLTILRAVCSHWNSVILSHPCFWNSIHIHLPTQTIPPYLLRAWLQRSRDASLNISVMDNPPLSWARPEMEARHELMLVIMPHISRCRSLQLDISLGLLPGFQSLRISDAQRLEHVKIDMKGNTDEYIHTTALRQLANLPLVRSLSWSSYSALVLKWLLQLATPSWLDQLTNIDLRCPVTAGEALELLIQCKSASRMTINHIRSDVSVATRYSSPPTILPDLHFLDITLPTTIYRLLLERIAFPNLRTLKVCGASVSDLSDTIPFSVPSLGTLQVKLSTDQNIIDEICTFLRHPNILRLPVLEIESVEHGGWDEYGGWNVLNDRPLLQAVEGFNKSNAGARTIKYNVLSKQYRSYYVGWTDTPLNEGKCS